MTNVEFLGEREPRRNRPSFVQLASLLTERIASDLATMQHADPTTGQAHTPSQHLMSERLRYMQGTISIFDSMSGGFDDSEQAVEYIRTELIRLNDLLEKSCTESYPDPGHNPTVLQALQIDLLSLLNAYTCSRQ